MDGYYPSINSGLCEKVESCYGIGKTKLININNPELSECVNCPKNCISCYFKDPF